MLRIHCGKICPRLSTHDAAEFVRVLKGDIYELLRADQLTPGMLLQSHGIVTRVERLGEAVDAMRGEAA